MLNLKKLTVFTLLAFITVSCNDAELLKITRPVVKLERIGIGGGGTGFNTVDGVITNYHVCLEASHMDAIDLKGRKTTLRVKKRSAKHDLCLLERVKYLSVVKIRTRPLVAYEKVIYAGYPGMQGLDVRYGVYTQSDHVWAALGLKPAKKSCAKGLEERKGMTVFGPMSYCGTKYHNVRTTIRTYQGASGSPLYDTSGRLVGIIQSVMSRSNQANALPVSVLREFLKGD